MIEMVISTLCVGGHGRFRKDPPRSHLTRNPAKETTARMGKSLLCRHEYLSLIARTQAKKLGMVCTLGKERDVGPQGSLASQLSLMDEFLAE